MAEKDKLIGVQYLRAIAALMVAYYHLISQIPAFSGALSFTRVVTTQRLFSGIDIFFVISGFIMYVTARKLSAGEFAWRRLIRIVPLYWILTLALCAMAMLDAANVHHADITPGHVLKSLLFIPYHNPAQGGMLWPALVPGWTLNYEMAFYALFAGSLLLPKYRTRTVVAVLAAAVVAGAIWSRSETLSVWGFYTSNRVGLFAAGMVLGRAYGSGTLRMPRWLCVALVLVGFWGVLSDWPPVATDRSIELVSSIAIVLGVLAWERQFGMPRWRPALWLGDASYSIYLAHLFAFGIVRSLWKHVEGPAWEFAAISMAAAIVFGILTYSMLERPSLQLLRQVRERWQGQLSVRIGAGARDVA
jgi:exopolysaccharide production protein ExoZ